MYRASANEQESVEIDFSGSQPLLNGQPFEWDFVRLNDRLFHILHRNRSYTAEVLHLDVAEKTVTLKINQTVHQVKLKDRFDLLLEKMGMNTAAQSKLANLKAPMPGLILNLSVQPGYVVHKGDPILILEAMKMENVIKAPGDGVIKAIRVTKGDSVEKNQVLIEFS